MLDLFLDILGTTGKKFINFVANIGHFLIFFGNASYWAFKPPWYFKKIFQQILDIGYFSLPVVGLTTFFSGMVLALQTYNGFTDFNSESTVARIVLTSITRELGPVLGGLMVAGRVSSSIAAELGTMRVTEQLDALVTLSTDPMKYLVAPRVLAATIAMPILVAVGDTIGILGGYLVGTGRLGFNSNNYLQNTVDFMELEDITSGLAKAAVFGFIIALMGCYHGYNSGRGAQGVGKATINAVVSASVMILAANYVLTEAFF